MNKHVVPDCLVLKMEENKGNVCIFILYDSKEEQYVIRGWNYSFTSKLEEDVVDFVEYVFCKNDNIDEILYNYDNLPNDSNEITFKFLNDFEDEDYEIASYYDKKMERINTLKNVRMLKKIYNCY